MEEELECKFGDLIKIEVGWEGVCYVRCGHARRHIALSHKKDQKKFEGGEEYPPCWPSDEEMLVLIRAQVRAEEEEASLDARPIGPDRTPQAWPAR